MKIPIGLVNQIKKALIRGWQIEMHEEIKATKENEATSKPESEIVNKTQFKNPIDQDIYSDDI